MTHFNSSRTLKRKSRIFFRRRPGVKSISIVVN